MLFIPVIDLIFVIVLDLTSQFKKTPKRYELLSHLNNLLTESVLFGFFYFLCCLAACVVVMPSPHNHYSIVTYIGPCKVRHVVFFTC
jgi:hypothetical protein